MEKVRALRIGHDRTAGSCKTFCSGDGHLDVRICSEQAMHRGLSVGLRASEIEYMVERCDPEYLDECHCIVQQNDDSYLGKQKMVPDLPDYI